MNCLHFMYLGLTLSIGERCSKATVKESSIRSLFPSSWGMASKCSHSISSTPRISQQSKGAGAGPAGTAAAGPMLEAKFMNLIKGQLWKF